MRFCSKLIAITLLIAGSTQLLAQPISKKWESRYSATGFSDESPLDVLADQNGNAFVLGRSGADAVLSKYDNIGTLKWTFQAGRGEFLETSSEDTRDFAVDNQGNSYLALFGATDETPYYREVTVIKIAPDGKKIWQQYLEASEARVRLALIEENSVVVIYNGNGGVAVSRLAQDGAILWTNKISSLEPQYIRDVVVLNNSIVASHHPGYHPYQRTTHLHVYNPDGTVKWEFAYKYPDYGTALMEIVYHQNEFIANYFIDNTARSFSQIVRYNAATGDVIKSFNYSLDDDFYEGTEVEVMTVGDDSQIFVLEQDELVARKYTLDGTVVWSKDFNVEYEYEILDFVPQKTTSSVDVLLRTEFFNNGDTYSTYSAVSFLPDKTSRLLANLSATKPSILPNGIAVSSTNVFFAGEFNNGDDYQRDMTLSQFTTNNTHQWTATFQPVNSQPNSPACITGDSEGNVYVGGTLWTSRYHNGFGIIKYDAGGNQVWIRKIAPDDIFGYDLNPSIVLAIAVNQNKDIFVTGVVKVANTESRELYTIKLDANGNTLWTKKTSGVIGDFYFGFRLALDNNGNVYVLGYNRNKQKDERNQMVLIKYDSNGDLKWERRFGQFPGYIA